MFEIFNKSGLDLGPLEDLIQEFMPFAQERHGFQHPPKLFLLGDEENAADPLGKTGGYNPDSMEVTIYVSGRHPKDILRSLSHELVHHNQNERGDLSGAISTALGYAQEDPHMREMEREAYEQGNLCLRDWEDGRKKQLQESIYYETIIGGDKMSEKTPLKEWKDNEINTRLMEKFGLLKEAESGASDSMTIVDDTTAEKKSDEEEPEEDEDESISGLERNSTNETLSRLNEEVSHLLKEDWARRWLPNWMGGESSGGLLQSPTGKQIVLTRPSETRGTPGAFSTGTKIDADAYDLPDYVTAEDVATALAPRASNVKMRQHGRFREPVYGDVYSRNPMEAATAAAEARLGLSRPRGPDTIRATPAHDILRRTASGAQERAALNRHMAQQPGGALTKQSSPEAELGWDLFTAADLIAGTHGLGYLHAPTRVARATRAANRAERATARAAAAAEAPGPGAPRILATGAPGTPGGPLLDASPHPRTIELGDIPEQALETVPWQRRPVFTATDGPGPGAPAGVPDIDAAIPGIQHTNIAGETTHTIPAGSNPRLYRKYVRQNPEGAPQTPGNLGKDRYGVIRDKIDDGAGGTMEGNVEFPGFSKRGMYQMAETPQELGELDELFKALERGAGDPETIDKGLETLAVKFAQRLAMRRRGMTGYDARTGTMSMTPSIHPRLRHSATVAATLGGLGALTGFINPSELGLPIPLDRRLQRYPGGGRMSPGAVRRAENWDIAPIVSFDEPLFPWQGYFDKRRQRELANLNLPTIVPYQPGMQQGTGDPRVVEFPTPYREDDTAPSGYYDKEGRPIQVPAGETPAGEENVDWRWVQPWDEWWPRESPHIPSPKSDLPDTQKRDDDLLERAPYIWDDLQESLELDEEFYDTLFEGVQELWTKELKE